MVKKLTLLMAAVAVVALAVPALASASKITEGGSLIPVNTLLLGTSTDATTVNTGLGTLTCEHVEIGAKVTSNNGTTVGAVGNSPGATENCEIEGLPVEIVNPKLVSLSSTTTGSGTVSLTFEFVIPEVIRCHFEASGAQFTYTGGSDSIFVHPTLLTPSQSACGEEAEFSGNFTITTTNGTPVNLD